MRCQDVREDAELYAIGALDGSAREALDQHAESCAECRDLLETETFQAAKLGFAAPLHHAPPELYGQIRRQLMTEDRTNRRQFAPLHFVRPSDPMPSSAAPMAPSTGRRAKNAASTRWRWALGIAACMAVLSVFGAAAWIADLQMQVHRLVSRGQSLDRRMADMEGQRDAVMLLVSEGTQRFAMQSADASSHARGAVIWNASEHKCSIFAAGLPPPPPDQAYHVWLMGGNHSWDEGELSASENGAAEKTIDLSRYATQSNYQLVVSRQPRQSAGGEWQPVLQAWVGD